MKIISWAVEVPIANSSTLSNNAAVITLKSMMIDIFTVLLIFSIWAVIFSITPLGNVNANVILLGSDTFVEERTFYYFLNYFHL